MRAVFPISLLTAAAALVAATTVLADGPPPAAPNLTEQSKRGEEVYRTVCAACHSDPSSRAPALASLRQTRSSEYILKALTVGAMKDVTAGVSLEDKTAVATWLIGRAPSGAADVDPMANRCKQAPAPLVLSGSAWNGWGGVGVTNARYQPNAGFVAGDIARLKLKWAFAYPGGVSNEPTVVGGRVFVSNMAGITYSLDANTGCTIWAKDLGAPMRTMIPVAKLPSGRIAAFVTGWFGDVRALDANTGEELWQVRPEGHPAVRVSSSPTYYQGRIYLGFSSGEEVLATDKNYVCCTFRGSVVSLDASTGRTVWKAWAIDRAPGPIPGDSHRRGPSGAGIWYAPTIDVARKLVYVATGDIYSDPDTGDADAVMAFDLATGKRRWTTQTVKGDVYVSGCDGGTRHINCPTGPAGPDFDLGGSPMLIPLGGGKDIVIGLGKNGHAYGMDPDQGGKIVWTTRLGRGGKLGGVEWGGATDGSSVYVPISDTAVPSPMIANDLTPNKPGLNAIDAATGKLLWHVPAPKVACSWGQPCNEAHTGAAAAVPGAVFAGSWDGHIRAYAAKDGAMLWDFDTGGSFEAVNGGKADGGTVDHGALSIAGGMVFVNSGGRYGNPGNALLVFSVDGK